MPRPPVGIIDYHRSHLLSSCLRLPKCCYCCCCCCVAACRACSRLSLPNAVICVAAAAACTQVTTMAERDLSRTAAGRPSCVSTRRQQHGNMAAETRNDARSTLLGGGTGGMKLVAYGVCALIPELPSIFEISITPPPTFPLFLPPRTHSTKQGACAVPPRPVGNSNTSRIWQGNHKSWGSLGVRAVRSGEFAMDNQMVNREDLD